MFTAIRGIGESKPPTVKIKPSEEGGDLAVFAELFSAKGVGVLYRATTTGTMTVDWKPVHAFPSNEAAEAQTKLEAAEFRQAFYRVAVHEMEIHPDMVWVPPGEFQLGSPDEESERYADEGPQQLTIIPVGFWVHKYEVTQAEYIDLMGNNPSFGYNADSGELAADLPVDSVTWEEAKEYCRRFNERELKAGRVPSGYEYRLPTEAEWMIAASRYGQTSIGDAQGVLAENSGQKTHSVGAKLTSANGIFDLYGNVWEWCHDYYGESTSGRSVDPIGPATAKMRVARGGSWRSPGKDLTQFSPRYSHLPANKSPTRGFRLVRTQTLGK